MKNNNSLAKKLKDQFGNTHQYVADERELNVLPECKDYIIEYNDSISTAQKIYNWSNGGDELLAQAAEDIPVEI